VVLLAVAATVLVLRDDEAVVNGSADVDTSGWQASSDVGDVRVLRFSLSDGPEGADSAVDLRRGPGTGKWALALARLRQPESFFRVGRTYRMRIWVRDLNASGATVGLLLADSNYRGRPTETSRYLSFRDRNWHLITRTFVCTARAGKDTRLYLALPPGGALHWQVTRASVQEVDPVQPPQTSADPARVVAFPGAAGTPPNRGEWTHELGGHGWGNKEVQTYVDDPSTAHVDGGGHLVITAYREDTVGTDGVRRPYKSARLSTAGKVLVQPGSYVESSIRFPVGSGVWPAFWLLGSDLPRVGWPAAGELDIAEVFGRDPTVAHSTVHVARRSDSRVDFPYGGSGTGGSTDLHHPLDTRFHRYGVYFDGDLVRFYIDRRPTLTLTAEDAVVSGRTWPFARPLYLILNVAVGGEGKGDPALTTFPREMVVGPISIWKGGIPF